MAVLRNAGNLARYLLDSRLDRREQRRREAAQMDQIRLRSYLTNEENKRQEQFRRDTQLQQAALTNPDVAERFAADNGGIGLPGTLKTTNQMERPNRELIEKADKLEALPSPEGIVQSRAAQGPIGPRQLPMVGKAAEDINPNVDRSVNTEGLAQLAGTLNQREAKKQSLLDTNTYNDDREIAVEGGKSRENAIQKQLGETEGAKLTLQDDLVIATAKADNDLMNAIKKVKALAGPEAAAAAQKAAAVATAQGKAEIAVQMQDPRINELASAVLANPDILKGLDKKTYATVISYVNSAGGAVENAKNARANATINQSLNVIDQLEKIYKDDYSAFAGAFSGPDVRSPGSLMKLVPWLGGKPMGRAGDVQQLVKQLSNTLTAEQLDLIRGLGPMSDGDRGMAGAVASLFADPNSLNAAGGLTEDQAYAEITKLKAALSLKRQELRAQTVTARPAAAQPAGSPIPPPPPAAQQWMNRGRGAN